MSRRLLSCLMFAACAALSAAEMPPPGLPLRAPAPGFTLKNSSGAEVSLASLLARGPVALVFYRSADWCPYCRKQLQDLQKNRAAIEAAGVQLVGISYDSMAVGVAAAAKLGLTFPLLSDPDSKVIEAYGIRNRQAKGKAAGVPHPVVFIVDGQGVIRAKLGRENYRDRPEFAEIVAAAREFR